MNTRDYRTGCLVTHAGMRMGHASSTLTGRIVACSHARDRYLVLWTLGKERWQESHVRASLKPVR